MSMLVIETRPSVHMVYVRLPQEQQRPCGPCSCPYCQRHPHLTPMWDALAVPTDGGTGPGREYAFTVHMPEGRGLVP